MSPFRRRKERRKLLDVHFRPLHQPKKIVFRLRKIVSGLWGSEEILDLRQNFSRQPEFRMIAVFLTIGILLFSFQKIFTRAEVADFSPATCLGTWENPQNAQGEPQTFKANESSSTLTEENSAIYRGGNERIFCGNFVPPEYETKGQVKSVGLTVILQVGKKALSDFEATTTILTPLETTSTTPTSTPPEENTTSSGASFWIKDLLAIPVFAQEQESEILSPSGPPPIESPPEEAPTPEPSPIEPTSTSTIVAPPIFAPLEPLTTTTESTEPATTSPQASTTEPVIIEPVPDQNFLQVSYSFDGQEWTPIGKINPDNWPHFTIELPIRSWDELKRLQISLEGIDTSLPKPLVKTYLDGLFLEVHYDLPPVFQNPSPGDVLEPAKVITLSPGVTIEIPPKKVPQLVPEPEIVSLTKLPDDSWRLKIRYLGPFFGQSLNVFLYPAGTKASRNDAQSAFAFAEEPAGPYIDAIQLFQGDFNGNGEAEFDIIAPDANPNYGLNTKDMRAGAYNIDIAYFGGETWRLTPVHSFVWP